MTETVDLEIGGMTCASCATRIAKRLSKLDGVEASVNYATEHATVEVPEGTPPGELIAQVEAIGYSARVPAPIGAPAVDHGHDAAPPEPEDHGGMDMPLPASDRSPKVGRTNRTGRHFNRTGEPNDLRAS